MRRRQKKLLALASGGGHWVQLLRLRPAFDGCAISYATVQAASASDVGNAPLYVFHDSSRRDWWNFAIAAVQVSIIVLRVRPNVLVTTGAMPPLAALLVARLIGARTLWVDSIANSEKMSGSGGLARRIANRTITQWPALATLTTPYWGSVL